MTESFTKYIKKLNKRRNKMPELVTPQNPKLIIELDIRTGSVNVSGPITDKVLCYGLLGIAHDVIKDHNPEKNNIVIPNLKFTPGRQN